MTRDITWTHEVEVGVAEPPLVDAVASASWTGLAGAALLRRFLMASVLAGVALRDPMGGALNAQVTKGDGGGDRYVLRVTPVRPDDAARADAFDAVMAWPAVLRAHLDPTGAAVPTSVQGSFTTRANAGDVAAVPAVLAVVVAVAAVGAIAWCAWNAAQVTDRELARSAKLKAWMTTQAQCTAAVSKHAERERAAGRVLPLGADVTSACGAAKAAQAALLDPERPMMPLGGATGDAFSLGSMLVPAALTAWVLLDG